MHKIKIVVLTGILAFVGIIIIQIYWFKKAFDFEEKKISQNIQVSLLDVAHEVSKHYGYKTAVNTPVQKLSNDYYIVNIRNDFDAGILEYYLTNTFIKKNIGMDYEYAIYDCETDKMVYGSYVNMSQVSRQKPSAVFPKAHNLVYYFALRFPQKNKLIFASLQLWVILSIIMVVVLLIYLYSIYVILQQKRYADLQRDFINNMTHEFKTPLSSILIASNFLAKQPSILADSKLEKYTHIIIDQSKKLDGHIEKVLNLAKSDIAPIVLNKVVIDVNKMIKNTIEIIQLKYPDARIYIETSHKNYHLLADPFHFANIIYNFLENAIKYCNQIPVIYINMKQKNNEVTIEFCDNGIGIPAKYLSQVFEKFFRVPDIKNNAVNGFGLGLYYAQNICQLHHWKLTINSKVNAGTILQLTIKQ